MSAVPPAGRSRLWRHINRASASGSFRLQVCARCGRVQYPPQEFCSHCLADSLSWEDVNSLGQVLSWTSPQASNDEFFKDKLPLNTGLIQLDCGPVLFAYLAASCRHTGSRVQVSGWLDKSGQAVFVAAPPETDPSSEFSNILMEEVKHDKEE